MGPKKWFLNTGGLLIKGVCIVWLSFGTSGSGRSRQVVTEYKWSQDRFHCIDQLAGVYMLDLTPHKPPNFTNFIQFE